jgi:ribosomal protein S6
MKTITPTNEYSILMCVKDNLDDSDIKNFGLKYGKALKSFGAVELNVFSKGRQNLAYPIKKNSIAKFIQINFTIAPGALDELAKIMKFDEDILRSSILRNNPK